MQPFARSIQRPVRPQIEQRAVRHCRLLLLTVAAAGPHTDNDLTAGKMEP